MSAVLVIAGTDSSGGAGLVRDVRTLAHLGVEALCAVTAVTAQTDTAVSAVHPLPPDVVAAQIAAALASGRVTAVKIGMLATAEIVAAVADALEAAPALPWVLDPVCASSSGAALLDARGRRALRERLLPRASLVTPNVAEAALLLGTMPATTMAACEAQGRALLALGARAVLVKGGHLADAAATDLLLRSDAALRRYTATRAAQGRRGTGCALGAAIAAGLARGVALESACARAKDYVTHYIAHGD